MKKIKMCLDCGKEKKSEKGRYCKVCGYRHRIRPKGLKYKVKVKNRGWFKKGHMTWCYGLKGIHLSPKTEIKKGQRLAPETEFRKGENKGDENYKWRGDCVGYYALHGWLTRNYGKPSQCELCGNTEKVEWVSKNYRYTRKRKDWLHLCYWCHRKYDSKNGWGEAVKKFPEIRRTI